MPALFITAVGTDVGKTFVACGIIAALRAAGRPVDAFKPVLSGYQGYAGSDAARLLDALGRDEADLERPDTVRDLIRRESPDIVINAAAWTAVDAAEEGDFSALR